MAFDPDFHGVNVSRFNRGGLIGRGGRHLSRGSGCLLSRGAGCSAWWVRDRCWFTVCSGAAGYGHRGGHEGCGESFQRLNSPELLLSVDVVGFPLATCLPVPTPASRPDPSCLS